MAGILGDAGADPEGWARGWVLEGGTPPTWGAVWEYDTAHAVSDCSKELSMIN